MAANPAVTREVIETARLAYKDYIEENLPLINPETTPEDFQTEAEKAYGSVLRGGALEGKSKPGDDEVKIKMHIKTVTVAAAMIANATNNLNQDSAEPSAEVISGETFYSATQDVFRISTDSKARRFQGTHTRSSAS